jgi:hypothetical protein
MTAETWKRHFTNFDHAFACLKLMACERGLVIDWYDLDGEYEIAVPMKYKDKLNEYYRLTRPTEVRQKGEA